MTKGDQPRWVFLSPVSEGELSHSHYSRTVDSCDVKSPFSWFLLVSLSVRSSQNFAGNQAIVQLHPPLACMLRTACPLCWSMLMLAVHVCRNARNWMRLQVILVAFEAFFVASTPATVWDLFLYSGHPQWSPLTSRSDPLSCSMTPWQLWQYEHQIVPGSFMDE